MLHCRLRCNLTTTPSDSSLLRYILKTVPQQQVTVKFHGVFASHWKSPAFAPGRSVRETLVRDSGDLVIPFMQVVNQTTRYYAHFVTNSFLRTGSNISADLHISLYGSDCIFKSFDLFGMQSLRILDYAQLFDSSLMLSSQFFVIILYLDVLFVSSFQILDKKVQSHVFLHFSEDVV